MVHLWQRSGTLFIKEIQQNVSLILNSELIYLKLETVSVLEPLIWVSSVNSEKVHSELHACTTSLSRENWSGIDFMKSTRKFSINILSQFYITDGNSGKVLNLIFFFNQVYSSGQKKGYAGDLRTEKVMQK